MKTSDYKTFSYLENGDVIFSRFSSVRTTKELIPGSYRLDYVGHPKYEVELKMDEDTETTKTHNFPDKPLLDKLFAAFFRKDMASSIKALGLHHKVGVLLYGSEGTGKSTIMKYYYSKAIEQDKALVFHMVNTDNLHSCWKFIKSVREIQSNPIIIILDELDSFLSERGNEAILKTMLDGNISINNTVFFASTNYIDRIPNALKSRPSRFKYCLKIEGIQSQEDIQSILSPLLCEIMSKEDIIEASTSLKGKTLDEIKQFCLDKVLNLISDITPKKRIGF